jgi:hypothetical protein
MILKINLSIHWIGLHYIARNLQTLTGIGHLCGGLHDVLRGDGTSAVRSSDASSG